MADDPTETNDDAPEAAEVPEPAEPAEAAATDADLDADAGDETGDEAEEGAGQEATSEKKAKADAVIAERQARQVTRRTVTSRRVTPKGGPAAAKAAKADKDAPPKAESKARDAKKTEAARRHVPPTPARAAVYDKGPSPWWVPAIMFFLLIAGALVIMSNYMGVFGDASNVRLVIGLGLILGGIITATQYR